MIKAIPTSNSLSEAGIKAGYAPTTCKSNIYSMKDKIRQDLKAQGYDKASLQAEFHRIAQICEETGDYSLTLRALEAIQKYTLQDRANNNIALFNLSQQDSDTLRSKLKTHSVEDKTQVIDSVEVTPIEGTDKVNLPRG